MTQIAGSGALGDSRLYVIVSSDVKCDGFAFMGKSDGANALGESMGYLPRNSILGGDFDLID